MSNAEKKDGWVGVLNGRPKTGQFSERSRTTKMADIHSFTEMTGDKNPVHYDEELAKKNYVWETHSARRCNNWSS